MKSKLWRICIIICVGGMLCIYMEMKMILPRALKTSKNIGTVWNSVRVYYNLTQISVASGKVAISKHFDEARKTPIEEDDDFQNVTHVHQRTVAKDFSKQPGVSPQTPIEKNFIFGRVPQINGAKSLPGHSGSPPEIQTAIGSVQRDSSSKASNPTLISDITKFFTITDDKNKDPFINEHTYDFNHLAYGGAIEDLFLIIIIHSAPGNFRKREHIRATYGFWSRYKGKAMTVVFMMGSVEDHSTQKAIDKENQLHNDIVQGKFLDNYQNQNQKHVMGFHWFKHLCVAEYVLKVDDDTFVNPYRVVDFLMDVKPSGLTMHCSIGSNIKPNRNKSSKSYISPEEFPFHSFPDFCLGTAYLTTSEALNAMYKASETTRPMTMDSVFVTLVLALQANVQNVDMKTLITSCQQDKSYDVNEIYKAMVVYDPLNHCDDLTLQYWNQIKKQK